MQKHYLYIKTLFLVAICVAASLALCANPNNDTPRKGFDTDKLVFGGQLGLGFGAGTTDFWSLYVSPQLGYRLTDRLVAGVGVSYTYAQHKNSYIDGYKKKQNQFGFNLFTDFYVSNLIFVTARPEIFYQRAKWNFLDHNNSRVELVENDFFPALVVGAGISLGVVVLSLNYDLVQHHLSPYGSTVFVSAGVRF